MRKEFYLSIVFGCFLALPLTAQNNINPVIQVERPYEASLMDVTKPKLDTSVPDSLKTISTLFQYTLQEKPLHNLYAFSPLPSAILVHSDTYARPRYGLLDLGFASPCSPTGSLFLQLPTSPSWIFGLNTTHHSEWANDTRDAQGFTDRMRNNGSLRLEHRGTRNTFYFQGDIDNLYHTFNSTLDSTLYSHGPLAHHQTYFRVGGSMGLSSADTTRSSWRYNLTAGYWHAVNELANYDRQQMERIRENVLRVNGMIGYNILSSFSVNLGGAAAFASDQWALSAESASHAVLELFPHINWSGERFKVAVGGRFDYSLESPLDSASNALHAYPWADMHLVLAPDWLVVYGKLDGKTSLNTYQDRIQEMPWLHTPSLHNAHTPWDAQVGLKGSVHDVFSYRLYAGYCYTKGKAYYVPEVHPTGTPGYYTLAYVKEKRYTLGGSLTLSTRSLDALLSAEYHHFDICTGNPPWHQPKLEVTGMVRYNWRERILATLTGYYRGVTYAPDIKAAAPYVTLPGYFSLDLRLEYVWNRFFSTYLYGLDLLNQNTQEFYLYDDVDLSCGIGITFRF